MHAVSYTLLRIAVIHQLSQYNGLSKGPIFQVKHLHTAVPSRAAYHCITFPVNGKHSCTVGCIDDWVELLFIPWVKNFKWLRFPRWQRRGLFLLITPHSWTQRAAEERAMTRDGRRLSVNVLMNFLWLSELKGQKLSVALTQAHLEVNSIIIFKHRPH